MRKWKAANLAVLLRSVVNGILCTMDSKSDMYGFSNVTAFLFGGHFKTAVTLLIQMHSVHYSKPNVQITLTDLREALSMSASFSACLLAASVHA